MIAQKRPKTLPATMGLSASAVGSLLLLCIGLILALMTIGDQSRQMKEENQVTTPLIGLSQRQGPWPKCLGMESDNCVHYIESIADDVRGHVEVIPSGGVVSMDFNQHRVRVYVDEDDLVTHIPSRG